MTVAAARGAQSEIEALFFLEIFRIVKYAPGTAVKFPVLFAVLFDHGLPSSKNRKLMVDERLDIRPVFYGFLKTRRIVIRFAQI